MNIFLWAAVIALAMAVYRRKILDRIKLIYYGWFIPGPPVYFPIIFNGITYVNMTTMEAFNDIAGLMRKYGPTYRLWIATDLVLFTEDCELIEKVLTSSELLTKSYEYEMAIPWLNEGLLLSSGKKWTKRRKMLTPAFHFSTLENYVEIFDKQTNTLVEKMKEFQNKKRIQLEDDLTLCALDVVFESTLGTNMNAQKPGSVGYEYAMNTKEFTEIMHYRIKSALYRNHFLWKFAPSRKRHDELVRELHSVTSKIVKEKRMKFNESGAMQIDFTQRTDVYGSKAKHSFLDILLQSKVDGYPLSDSDIREEVDGIIYAGHDTTKTALTFTLYNIIKYPDVHQKCFEEIKSVFGSDKTNPTTIKHLSSLKYLELVIKETMRLFPSVPIIGRAMTESVTLENGMVFPKGSQMGIFIFTLGRSPKLYSDPEVFRPERFEELTADRTSAFQYIPFSAGHRSCIGQKFAMLEVKATISKILRHYELSLSEETINSEFKLDMDITLKPGSEISYDIKERVY